MPTLAVLEFRLSCACNGTCAGTGPVGSCATAIRANEVGMSSFKIAIIGAGSVGFTKKLFTDILCVPEFSDVEFALTDISAAQSRHDPARSSTGSSRPTSLPTKVTATTDRREALDGARYVISCVRVGGLEAYADDIRIPLKYGVDQCVGDTICAGGILYGQRNIPVILDFCKDIREVAEPGAQIPQLCQPDGDEHLGGDRIRQGRYRSGSATACSTAREQIAEVLGATTRRARLRLLGHQPPDLVHRHPLSAAARSARTNWSPPSRRTRSIRSRRRCASTS